MAKSNIAQFIKLLRFFLLNFNNSLRSGLKFFPGLNFWGVGFRVRAVASGLEAWCLALFDKPA